MVDRKRSFTQHERKAYSQGYTAPAGLDEAGRGPLAGPVVAAACIIPRKLYFEQVDDSKKVPPHIREKLYDILTSHPDIVWGVGVVEHTIIDQINILQATIRAMLEAVSALKKVPDCLLVDGMHLPHPTLPSVKIIDGDAKSHTIAAASILAKVTRDRLMEKYHTLYPEYGFDRHKGYGTEAHLDALQRHGPCPLHRMSFAPLKNR